MPDDVVKHSALEWLKVGAIRAVLRMQEKDLDVELHRMKEKWEKQKEMEMMEMIAKSEKSKARELQELLEENQLLRQRLENEQRENQLLRGRWANSARKRKREDTEEYAKKKENDKEKE